VALCLTKVFAGRPPATAGAHSRAPAAQSHSERSSAAQHPPVSSARSAGECRILCCADRGCADTCAGRRRSKRASPPLAPLLARSLPPAHTQRLASAPWRTAGRCSYSMSSCRAVATCATFPLARIHALTPTQAQGQLKLSSNGFYWRNTAGGKEVNINAAGTRAADQTSAPASACCFAAPRRSASRLRLLNALGLGAPPRGLAAVLCTACEAHSLRASKPCLRSRTVLLRPAHRPHRAHLDAHSGQLSAVSQPAGA